MHIDIVIVTYNSQEHIQDCIESILTYTSLPISIYVVDNGSTDDTLAYLASNGEINVLKNNENAGYAKAVNLGITAGSGDVIAIMNADTKVTEHWLEALTECLYSDPRIAIVGPKMINADNQLVGVGTSWNWEAPAFMQLDRPGLLEEQRDCLVVNGACFLIKRENIAQLGLMDEHYFFYFEETDYCFHAVSKGYRVVFCPQSVIYHAYQFDARRIQAVNQYWQASAAYFNSKWSYDVLTKEVRLKNDSARTSDGL